MNRNEFQFLADIRIREAEALLASVPPLPDGAYYLAGYAVECALKAAIARLNNQHDWPEKSFVLDCHSHDLLKLVRLAGLESERLMDCKANTDLSKSWSIVDKWNESSRYLRHTEAEALELIDAVANKVSGVMQWIKARW